MRRRRRHRRRPSDGLVSAPLAGDFAEEPDTAFCLVDPVLDEACGGDVVVFIAEGVGGHQKSRQLLIVIMELGEHGLRGEGWLVVVLRRW